MQWHPPTTMPYLSPLLYRSNWLTSTEHIRYITSNNLQSAYTIHILHNRYEYGPTNITMSLLHPVHKSQRMNSSENFYTHLFQQHITIINEQSQTDENPFFNLIYAIQLKHACLWPNIHSLPFEVWHQYSTAGRHYNITLLGT